MSAALPDLAGWVPIRIAWEGRRPVVDWCHLGEARFTEPFFEQTIEKRLRDPFALVFRHQTSIETLCEWAERQPGLAPSGFIFHMSRCGSTLVAQMLAALARNVVISEAPPIDAVLGARRLDPQLSDADRMMWLRAMLSALGQRRSGGEQHLFVKFDAWHALDLPLIRRAFPDVPWVFLHRDPVEVLASQMKSRASYLVPGMVDHGLAIAADAGSTMPPEEYCARVLAEICAATLDGLLSGGGFTLDYAHLPRAVADSLAGHFRLACNATDREQMESATQFDAKNPSLFFSPDSATKQSDAGDSLRSAAARWLQPLHERLAHFALPPSRCGRI